MKSRVILSLFVTLAGACPACAEAARMSEIGSKAAAAYNCSDFAHASKEDRRFCVMFDPAVAFDPADSSLLWPVYYKCPNNPDAGQLIVIEQTNSTITTVTRVNYASGTIRGIVYGGFDAGDLFYSTSVDFFKDTDPEFLDYGRAIAKKVDLINIAVCNSNADVRDAFDRYVAANLTHLPSYQVPMDFEILTRSKF